MLDDFQADDGVEFFSRSCNVFDGGDAVVDVEALRGRVAFGDVDVHGAGVDAGHFGAEDG